MSAVIRATSQDSVANADDVAEMTSAMNRAEADARIELGCGHEIIVDIQHRRAHRHPLPPRLAGRRA